MVNNSNLVTLLGHWAADRPDRMAYSFLKEDKTISSTLSYQKLEQQAKAIAALIQSQTIPGNRILLIYPPGVEFCSAFFGCLCAGAIAVPVPAPEIFGRSRIVSRINTIAGDAQISMILTTEQIKGRLEKLDSWTSQFSSKKLLVTDDINSEWANKWQEPDISHKTIAYLQYTSGSTADPKGAMIGYESLMSNLAYRQAIIGYQSDSIIANWTPHFHDYGLVAGLISALYAGISCYIMSPLAFMKRPITWLEIISDYRITHSFGPNFGYDYCIKHTTEQERQSLDLSNWQVAEVGAETIRPETLQNFTQLFQTYGFELDNFCPGYGLAEGILTFTGLHKEKTPKFLTIDKQALAQNQIVTIAENNINSSDRVTMTGSGYLVGDTKIVIVNPETLRTCADKEVGEIWAASKSVTQGYWHRPLDTKETFDAHLPEFRDRSFLRTGDLGFLYDGQLFLTGRLKDLIIIRGQNYYPQDIELTVEQSHPKLRTNSSAAFSVDSDDVETLVVTSEIDPRAKNNLDANEVFVAMRRAVIKNHGLALNAIALLKPGTIPKTSSGKIQRHASRRNFINQSLKNIAIWNSR